MFGGRAARQALRRRVEAECDMKVRRHAQQDSVDTPEDYALHAYRFWPDVKKMEKALSKATVETRIKAKALIRGLHDRRTAR